jgi:hypothetical protein
LDEKEMKNPEFKSKKLGNDTVYTLTEMTAGATGSGSVGTAVKGVGKLQRRADSIIMQDKESKDKPTPPTVRNPVAHAAQRVAKGSGSHDDKKFNRKEKHKKPHFEDDSMEESYWNHTGFGNRPGSGGSGFRDRERSAGLENEINNIGIMINGRKWKIFPGRGPEGSQEWFNQRQKMKDMCARKTAETGKQWTMYITGERPTNETVAENDMMSFFKDLQKNDPKYKNLRIHGDPEHDELRKQDELDRQKRRESDAERNKQAMAAQVERDRAMLPDLKAQLAELEKTFDPHYEYSDDYTLWSKQKAIASNIQRLRDRIAKAEGSVSEGNHPDEKEDKALIRKMVKPKALKKEDHSTASGGWGQGSYATAGKDSSKWSGAGRDEMTREDEYDTGEYDDEAGMLKNDLHTIARSAMELSKALLDNEKVPVWIIEKIAQSKGMMVTALDYMISQHELGTQPTIDDKPSPDDEYMSELFDKLAEKIPANAPVKTYIDDFEKAAKTPNAKGHHQFKNKSKEKIRQMAIAASYGAKNPSKKKK